MNDKGNKCPHCGGKLSRWCPPPESAWGAGDLRVCFNDECSYYAHGWQWMKDNYQQHASYRYRYDPKNGDEGPLPVWSADALRDCIVDEKEKE
uniref:Zinc finger Ogr/Delta-type domain-containing protein n=1 Tax=uncultured sulfate-reducing bacterium TaxID=153939 RepID=Q3IBN1_9BACT|nr:conserved hypothetical protein [uncultured sulfate-reducing bacterium]